MDLRQIFGPSYYGRAFIILYFAQFYQKVNTTMIVISACLKSESSQFYRKIEPNEGHKSDQSTETEVLVSCTILGYPLSCSKSALVGQAVSESSDLHTLFAVSTAHMSIRWDFILLLFLKNISSILDPNNVWCIKFRSKHSTVLQLNEYETDPYFFQNFQSDTTVCLIIHMFCKCYEP